MWASISCNVARTVSPDRRTEPSSTASTSSTAMAPRPLAFTIASAIDSVFYLDDIIELTDGIYTGRRRTTSSAGDATRTCAEADRPL